MDPENHWLVEKKQSSRGPLSGSMLVFGNVFHVCFVFLLKVDGTFQVTCYLFGNLPKVSAVQRCSLLAAA